jgi:hypothetical protein
MDPRALARLGHHVVSRRVALGFRSRTDLAKRLPFTVRTLADVEQGVRKASPGTYAMLENALAWVPGSIDTILTGGDPQETQTVCPTQQQTPSPAPPPRNCCWSYDAASSAHATDATRGGTTGTTALTHTATGPEEGWQPARAQVLSRAMGSGTVDDIEKSKVIWT